MVKNSFQRAKGDWGTADRVVVFPGAKSTIGLCQQTYCNPGDEIIYPSPGFPIYESFITHMGAQPVPLHLSEERDFSLSGMDIVPLITDKGKVLGIFSTGANISLERGTTLRPRNGANRTVGTEREFIRFISFIWLIRFGWFIRFIPLFGLDDLLSLWSFARRPMFLSVMCGRSKNEETPGSLK